MGTGLDTTLGLAPEAKYATYLEPTRFIEIESSSLARKDDYLSARPLRGRPGIPATRHKATTISAEGTIALEVPNKGLGILLDMLHGEEVEAEQEGETKAYKQVHPLGKTAPNGKSLSIQINKPTAAEDEPFTYLGCKVTQATFSCDTSDALKLSLEVNAANALTEKELEPAEYDDPIASFDFTQPTVEIGGEEIDEGLIIHSFNLAIPIPLKTGRWGLGHGAVQLEPHGFNDTMMPTWELSCEFSNLEMYELYVGGVPQEVSVSFEGSEIEGSGKSDTIAFVAPAAKFVGTDPEVGGPDVLDQTVSVEVYDELTKPLITITTISEDTEL